MSALPQHALAQLLDEVESIRLSNLAWIRQAESHNKASANLPGARERTPILEGNLFWLVKLAALSAAAGGDDARVAAMLDRALVKTTSEVPADG